MQDIKDAVSEFYGKTVQKTEDLGYSACCTTDYDTTLLKKLTDEVLEKRYGCGSPVSEFMDGLTVLDLGCGAGADCYIASQLVGPNGHVIGVDMTDEQLEVANRNIEPHMKNFGYDKPNIEFRKGFIEEIPAEDNSVDLIISNCVINLSDNKQQVFNEMWRILKPGGEFFVSDIVADRRVPAHLQDDDLLWSECLTGAPYVEDLRRMTRASGFMDVRVVKSRALPEVIEGIRFASRNMRGFKLELEDQCEDYGQVAIYKGTIEGHEKQFMLDDHHLFIAGTPMRVCKNSADMLSKTRFAKHFHVSEPLAHLGLFDCAPAEEPTPREDMADQFAFNGGSSCC